MQVKRMFHAVISAMALLLIPAVSTAQGSGTTANNQTVTVTFPFDKGGDGQTATYSDGADVWFKNSYTELGANLYYAGVALNQSKINPKISNEGSANDDNAVSFYIIPKKGITFKPTKISFKTTRYGTNGGLTDVAWVNSDGTSMVLEKGLKSERNNNVTDFSKEITDAKGSDNLCGLRLHLYSLPDNKQVGYGNIVIEGIVSGEVIPVKQCSFSVTSSPKEAGEVKATPASNIFDEGDAITVYAEENFSYHFAAWTDEKGNIVSTENPYTFNIQTDTQLKATYTKNTTYSLNINIEGGANNNLVQIQPEGKIIDGVRLYEEGTEVKLTTLNNRILTFVGWEDNTTDATRLINMDGNKDITATFSALDYIVGWDLYEDMPNKERAADYKHDSENAGLLSLHKADKTTSTWLTRGVNNGMENGKYAARSWRKLTDRYYFEISFSSKGFTNLVLSSAVGDDYNTYSIINAEYSIDGVNYHKFGTFNLPNRGWDGPHDFALPEEANDKDRVYIRWMPDYESPLTGVQSDNDGIAIAEVFVLADAGAMADEVATLVSSNPADGGTGVSASGSVILNFDNKIKAGTGKAMLNGEEIMPIISGKSAVFKYNGLKYSTNYTFSMPEGVLVSRSGNSVKAVEINFTTMERKQPKARVYDAVVAADGSGDHTTIQAAIDAAPEGRGTPWLIFIKNGKYKGHVDIPKNKPYIHLIGQNRDKVVITDDRLSGGDNAVHVSIGATVVVNSDNCFIENLTMENSYGHEKQSGPQALALNTIGDRIAMNKVALLSYQDTWITSSTSNNRHYIKNSLIEGAVDFIYNSGNVYLDGDTLMINRPSGGYIVAPSHKADVKWGYVFMNNVIRPYPGMKVTDVWLGRPWHNNPKTVFINTKTYVNIPAKGWYNTMGGLPVLWADYNTVDANGNPVDLSQREDYYYYVDNNNVKHEAHNVKNFLTDDEAAQYTVENVMNGDDGWQPDALCEPVDAPKPAISGNTIEWASIPYAICYVVTKNEEVAAITTDTYYDIPAGGKPTDKYTVYAANEQGGLSPAGEAGQTGTSITDITSGKDNVTAVKIYSADGRTLNKMQPGVNIVCKRMADGSTKTIKVIK